MLKVSELSDPDFWSLLKRTDATRVIIPVGSIEQHGPHLPVSTDTLIAEHVSTMVAEKLGALVLPCLTYGVSFEHDPMFHISLRKSTLASVLEDICVSLIRHSIKEIIIINGHHGNIGALQYISQDISERIPNAKKSCSVHVLHYWHQIKGAELGHAGEVETSLVLAIAPELVKMQKAQPSAKKLNKSKAAYSSILNSPGSFIRVTGNGVWGNPKDASAELGYRLLDEITSGLVSTILELSN